MMFRKKLYWVNTLIFVAEVVESLIFFFFNQQERLYNIAILVINRNIMSVTNSIYCCVIFGTRVLHELNTIACITIITRDVFAQGGRIIEKKREKENMITIRKEKQSLWNAVINLHNCVGLFFFWILRGIIAGSE